jgi:hypothetical protein
MTDDKLKGKTLVNESASKKNRKRGIPVLTQFSDYKFAR